MDPFIRGLLRPEAFDHPVESLNVLETHISWVILTGAYAYKLKKPVNFGFVDFSTLEQRCFYCEEELRLNRRLAEDLYLAVKPVFGPREQASFVGAGQPIEFAVQMRQFPQSCLLPAVLARGELTAELLDRLAEDVGRFQQMAAVANAETPYGTPQAVRAPVAENLRVLHALTVTELCFPDLLDSLQRWTEQTFPPLEPVFTARKAMGFVREGHGDMHLGNMVLRTPAGQSGRACHHAAATSEPRIQIFDCLEFNPALRWIDVINEIAFVVMDLADRGRSDLGARFLNSWLEVTGDYAGLKLWSWYYSYRALVRAKVAALRLGQKEVTAAEVESLSHQLHEYLQLGWQATVPRKPCLVITCGVSGSGKSYWSRELAAAWGYVRLRSDVERKRIFPEHGRRYTSQATETTYRKLLEIARDLLTEGFSVFVDAAFLRRDQRMPFRDLARTLQVPCQLIEFSAPRAILEQRIAARMQQGDDPSEATIEVLSQQLAQREPVDAEEGWPVIFCDTSVPDAVKQMRDMRPTHAD